MIWRLKHFLLMIYFQILMIGRGLSPFKNQEWVSLELRANIRGEGTLWRDIWYDYWVSLKRLVKQMISNKLREWLRNYDKLSILRNMSLSILPVTIIVLDYLLKINKTLTLDMFLKISNCKRRFYFRKKVPVQEESRWNPLFLRMNR